jgi:hypothetical protein
VPGRMWVLWWHSMKWRVTALLHQLSLHDWGYSLYKASLSTEKKKKKNPYLSTTPLFIFTLGLLFEYEGGGTLWIQIQRWRN